jgi:hypothetical protein
MTHYKIVYRENQPHLLCIHVNIRVAPLTLSIYLHQGTLIYWFTDLLINWDFLLIFSNGRGRGAQRPILRVNEPNKTGACECQQAKTHYLKVPLPPPPFLLIDNTEPYSIY